MLYKSTETLQGEVGARSSEQVRSDRRNAGLTVMLQVFAMIVATIIANRWNILGLGWVVLFFVTVSTIAFFMSGRRRGDRAQRFWITAAVPAVSLATFLMVAYFVFDWKGFFGAGIK